MEKYIEAGKLTARIRSRYESAGAAYTPADILRDIEEMAQTGVRENAGTWVFAGYGDVYTCPNCSQMTSLGDGAEHNYCTKCGAKLTVPGKPADESPESGEGKEDTVRDLYFRLWRALVEQDTRCLEEHLDTSFILFDEKDEEILKSELLVSLANGSRVFYRHVTRWLEVQVADMVADVKADLLMDAVIYGRPRKVYNISLRLILIRTAGVWRVQSAKFQPAE